MSTRVFQMILAGLLSLSCLGGANAAVPRVSTDIAPVHSLVARVMQGLGTPGQVVRQGASPHDYALRPSEAQSLEAADIVFWIGPALTPWLKRVIANLATDATVITLLEAPGTHVLDYRTEVQFAPPQAEALHDHSDHSHAGHDPHAWLDPENAKLWLGLIAEELARFDSENAEIYRANAEAGQVEISAVQARIKQRLALVQDLRFVVFHDAYQYFESRFGLSAAGAIAAGDAADPGPAKIKAVRQLIRDLNITCVFSEPAFNQSLVATVIEGTDTRASIIDPLGTGIAPGPDFYPELLESVAAKLADCAG